MPRRHPRGKADRYVLEDPKCPCTTLLKVIQIPSCLRVFVCDETCLKWELTRRHEGTKTGKELGELSALVVECTFRRPNRKLWRNENSLGDRLRPLTQARFTASMSIVSVISSGSWSDACTSVRTCASRDMALVRNISWYR